MKQHLLKFILIRRQSVKLPFFRFSSLSSKEPFFPLKFRPGIYFYVLRHLLTGCQLEYISTYDMRLHGSPPFDPGAFTIIQYGSTIGPQSERYQHNISTTIQCKHKIQINLYNYQATISTQYQHNHPMQVKNTKYESIQLSATISPQYQLNQYKNK